MKTTRTTLLSIVVAVAMVISMAGFGVGPGEARAEQVVPGEITSINPTVGMVNYPVTINVKEMKKKEDVTCVGERPKEVPEAESGDYGKYCRVTFDELQAEILSWDYTTPEKNPDNVDYQKRESYNYHTIRCRVPDPGGSGNVNVRVMLSDPADDYNTQNWFDYKESLLSEDDDFTIIYRFGEPAEEVVYIRDACRHVNYSFLRYQDRNDCPRGLLLLCQTAEQYANSRRPDEDGNLFEHWSVVTADPDGRNAVIACTFEAAKPGTRYVDIEWDDIQDTILLHGVVTHGDWLDLFVEGYTYDPDAAPEGEIYNWVGEKNVWYIEKALSGDDRYFDICPGPVALPNSSGQHGDYRQKGYRTIFMVEDDVVLRGSLYSGRWHGSDDDDHYRPTFFNDKFGGHAVYDEDIHSVAYDPMRDTLYVAATWNEPNGATELATEDRHAAVLAYYLCSVTWPEPVHIEVEGLLKTWYQKDFQQVTLKKSDCDSIGDLDSDFHSQIGELTFYRNAGCGIDFSYVYGKTVNGGEDIGNGIPDMISQEGEEEANPAFNRSAERLSDLRDRSESHRGIRGQIEEKKNERDEEKNEERREAIEGEIEGLEEQLSALAEAIQGDIQELTDLVVDIAEIADFVDELLEAIDDPGYLMIPDGNGVRRMVPKKSSNMDAHFLHYVGPRVDGVPVEDVRHVTMLADTQNIYCLVSTNGKQKPFSADVGGFYTAGQTESPYYEVTGWRKLSTQEAPNLAYGPDAFFKTDDTQGITLKGFCFGDEREGENEVVLAAAGEKMPIKVKSWSNNVIEADQPECGASGSVYVKSADGLVSNNLNYYAEPAPEYALLSSGGTEVVPGTSTVAIHGRDFGLFEPGLCGVSFLNREAEVIFWENDTGDGESVIFSRVPEGAVEQDWDNIRVSTPGGTSFPVSLYRTPRVTDIGEQEAHARTIVDVEGRDFGTYHQGLCRVEFEGATPLRAEVVDWTDDKISCHVPFDAHNGAIKVINPAGVSSSVESIPTRNPDGTSKGYFTSLTPADDTLSPQGCGTLSGLQFVPTSVVIGGEFEEKGTYSARFKEAPGNTRTFNELVSKVARGIPARITGRSDEALNCKVPQGVTCGKAVVTVTCSDTRAGRASPGLFTTSDGVNYYYRPPAVESAVFTKDGEDRVAVEVRGNYFGYYESPEATCVVIEDVRGGTHEAEVERWENRRITCEIPFEVATNVKLEPNGDIDHSCVTVYTPGSSGRPDRECSVPRIEKIEWKTNARRMEHQGPWIVVKGNNLGTVDPEFPVKIDDPADDVKPIIVPRNYVKHWSNGSMTFRVPSSVRALPRDAYLVMQNDAGTCRMAINPSTVQGINSSLKAASKNNKSNASQYRKRQYRYNRSNSRHRSRP